VPFSPSIIALDSRVVPTAVKKAKLVPFFCIIALSVTPPYLSGHIVADAVKTPVFVHLEHVITPLTSMVK
jgi:hypothetical protein